MLRAGLGPQGLIMSCAHNTCPVDQECWSGLAHGVTACNPRGSPQMRKTGRSGSSVGWIQPCLGHCCTTGSGPGLPRTCLDQAGLLIFPTPHIQIEAEKLRLLMYSNQGLAVSHPPNSLCPAPFPDQGWAAPLPPYTLPPPGGWIRVEPCTPLWPDPAPTMLALHSGSNPPAGCFMQVDLTGGAKRLSTTVADTQFL